MEEVEISGKSKILIIIIFILLCMGCFVGGVYVGKFVISKDDTKVGDKKDNTENTNNTDNKNNNSNDNNSSNDEAYDYTKDTKLKEMYELYMPSDWMGPIENLLEFKEEVIKDTDLSNDIKNYLGYAYKIYGVKDRKEICTNYLNLSEGSCNLDLGDENCYSACFEGNVETMTEVFDEKDLELSVKELFGNYTASTIPLSGGRFKYDSSSKKYVFLHIAAGGVHPAAANKLVSATKTGNTIVMTVLVSSKEDINDVKDSDYDYEYKFTFEVSDGNYIFKSLEKTLRK